MLLEMLGSAYLCYSLSLMEFGPRHQCLIYEGAPSEKLRVIAVILKRKMDEGYRCLYLNSAPMVAGLRSALAALGVDVSYEIAKGRMVLSSETDAPGEDFNPKELLVKLEDFLNQALDDGYKGLWATGDMAWEFGHKKDFSKLLEYEWGLEDIFRRRKELSGICQYHQDTLPVEALRQSLLTHPSILINETLSRINPHYLKNSNHMHPVPSPVVLDKMIASISRQQ